MLYNECETLLDSRFVKTDDNIRSGETLTFGAYLVDIGDRHREHKPTSNLNLQGMDKKINKKARSLHERSFKTNSSSIGMSQISPPFNTSMQWKNLMQYYDVHDPICFFPEDRKISSEMKKVPLINLSPSQKIIRG